MAAEFYHPTLPTTPFSIQQLTAALDYLQKNENPYPKNTAVVLGDESEYENDL